MAGEASIQLTGFVHKQPELRITNTGVPVLKMTVKVTGYNSRTQEKKDPSWYQVSVWRDAAEAAADSVKEGDRVIVVGSLEIGSYEKDGQKRYVPEVSAFSVGVIPPKPASSSKPAPESDGSPW